ncbi:carbohydrate-binding module family 33 protein [Botryobasidium botryosum FD-172 SS1]|uniref:Carbohydrate-binding module family 33 protein n=1 Tax=Botryobasidium botryosum (strain FD-172 SS1) TaxID=930990 RepID=A0A067MNS7_BOTB1|nr:carbohydrate-binding module family 33 protein [Botryobasidium botryosum FD-172 SS1]
MYEPQSVEAPQGSFECNGNGARFHELNNNALWANHFSLVPPGATHLTFTWTLTAPHRAATWEYFIGQTLLASFNDDGHMPPSSVEHSVSLHGFTGRHTILARWNIYDTINAFYSCVDLDISSHLHNATVLVAGADADASANVPLQQVLAIP